LLIECYFLCPLLTGGARDRRLSYLSLKDICMKITIFKSLYFQVITAITLGILLGHFYPEIGTQMKPPGDGFVKLIKMIIAPMIFCTVVSGIAGMEGMKAVGRTGAIALIYSTLRWSAL